MEIVLNVYTYCAEPYDVDIFDDCFWWATRDGFDRFFNKNAVTEALGNRHQPYEYPLKYLDQLLRTE